MSDWSRQAWVAIEAADKALPANVTPAERRKAIDAAYPFGERAMHPYKMWLKARRAYLAKHGALPKAAVQLSPLERAIANYKAAR